MTIKHLVFFAFVVVPGILSAQPGCLDNIGFTSGDFRNWECFTGRRDNEGAVTLVNSAPLTNRHVLVANSSTAIDRYGKFPVHSPGSSGYSVMLGNSGDGAEAEGIRYTFTVPTGIQSYSIIYQFATVAAYEAPEPEHKRPAFIATVFNVTDNQEITCSTNRVSPSPTARDMKRSDQGLEIYYMPWTSVTIDLSAYAGKVVRLEFTTLDCFFQLPTSGHFGYAYLDVSENCGAPVTGNKYCDAASITLTAPPGFKDYSWFTPDLVTLLNTGPVYEIKPAPPPGTVYALKAVPFSGQGCENTFYTTILPGVPVTDFVLKDTLYVCSSTTGDLRELSLTAGSGPDLTFSYFTDEDALIPVDNPSAIRNDGTYFIKATNSSGCYQVKSLRVAFLSAELVVTDPQTSYLPFSVNLTDPSVTRGSSQGFRFSYWRDRDTNIPLLSPENVKITGTYFIRAETGRCVKIAAVRVTVIAGVPNTFTPNGDGINDYFHVAGITDKVNFSIYNRWGELVFSARRSGNTWDGNTRGAKQPPGSYYWILESIDQKTNGKILLKGTITLIR